MQRATMVKRLAWAAMSAAILAIACVAVAQAAAQGAAQAGSQAGVQTAPASAPAPTVSEPAPTPAPAAESAPTPASVPAVASATVVAAAPAGGTIAGRVLAGETPLPGVAVTATHSLTGKKYATTTDIDGAYRMAVPKNGRYVVKTELAGFASTTHEVMVNAAGENGGLAAQTAGFKMDLSSRVAPDTTSTATASDGRPVTATVTGRAGAAGAVARVGRGTQALAVAGSTDSDLSDATAGAGNTGAQLPSLATSGDNASLASDSIAVSGQQGQINGLAGFSEDDLRNRIQDMQRNGMGNGDIAGALGGVMQSGSFGQGGPGGGGPGGGEGFGGGGGRGGGFGGGGGGFGGGGGRGGFGGTGFRGQNANAWHGSVGYTGSDSALNASSYSVTGIPILKPQSDHNSLVVSLTGTPYIPRLTKPNPKQFVFLSLSESRNTSPSTEQFIVPTLAQRAGDFSTIGQPVYVPTAGLSAGCTTALNQAGVTSAAIAQGLAQFPNNMVPSACFNAAALNLLSYYPTPNVNSPLTFDNYQANFPGSSHSAQLSGRYNRSFGAAPVRGARGGGGGRSAGGGQNSNAPPVLRQSIAENFAYSHSATANSSFSPALGGSSVSNGYSFTSAYTVGYGRINSTASLGWNRSRNIATNYFTNGALNPASATGIFVGNPQIYNNPFYYGVPSVSVTGGIAGLGDATPTNAVNQTISFSDFVSYSHKRHNMRFGFDFRRIHQDSIGTGGDLGSFTFSGFATESQAQQTCVQNSNPVSAVNPNPSCTFAPAGSSFADFLLGLPQQSAVTAGLNKIYLRGNSWDWYAQDDWRAKSNFTVSYGLRWEYLSPYSEKSNRLVNLNVSGIGPTLAVSTVCGTAAPAGSPAGVCAAIAPGTLVNPDKALYSPRVAIAWSPKYKWTKSMVVRSGYGINYNTGQYSRFATNLAFQQPFSVTQKNVQSSGATHNGCTLANMTLNNGFNCDQQLTQSSFAVDPNYRLGMVQVYNLGIQRTLPQGVVLNIDYTGSYAGNLDMVRAPNRTPSGLIVQSVGQFNYEDSLGYQRSNALAVNLRQRMHKGISLQATYKYSHSIDDASSVGGSGNSIAQNDQDLGAEESNSSFDQRHSLNGNFVIEPPFGPNRAFFNKGGLVSKILDGYSISGNFTFASGGWATPSYALTAEEIAAGAPSSLRPNRVAGVPIQGAGSQAHWFNTAAFSTPAYGTYGNASRNSIELPGTVALSGSLSRTVSFGETRSLEARISAANALNTVQYSGVSTQINSPTYGQVTSAAGMRALTYNLRYRF